MIVNEIVRNSRREKIEVLKKVIKTVALKNANAHVLGPPAIGKSTIVAEGLKEAGVIPAYAPHHTTPLGLYGFFYENRAGYVVADDSANNMEHPSIVAILKAATWPNPVTGKYTIRWHSTSALLEAEGLPKEFDFDGQIIFITNGQGFRKGSQNQPISSRLITIPFDLTFDERKDAIWEMALPQKFGISQEEMNAILAFLDRHARPGCRDFDLRILHKLSALVRTDPVGWEKVASHLLAVDPRYTLLKDVLDVASECPMNQQADLFRKLCERRGIAGCGRSTFFTLKNQWFHSEVSAQNSGVELLALIQDDESRNPTEINDAQIAEVKRPRGRPRKATPAIESKSPAGSNSAHVESTVQQ